MKKHAKKKAGIYITEVECAKAFAEWERRYVRENGQLPGMDSPVALGKRKAQYFLEILAALRSN